MSAVATEKIVRRLDGLKQVKGTNGAAGAEGLFAFARDDDGGAVVALDYARGRNADHAAVPAFAIDHDAVGVIQCRVAG